MVVLDLAKDAHLDRRLEERRLLGLVGLVREGVDHAVDPVKAQERSAHDHVVRHEGLVHVSAGGDHFASLRLVDDRAALVVRGRVVRKDSDHQDVGGRGEQAPDLLEVIHVAAVKEVENSVAINSHRRVVEMQNIIVGLLVFYLACLAMCAMSATEAFFSGPCPFPSFVLDKRQLDDLVSLFEKFKEVCAERDIRYWAIAGTLIGAVRNEGLMAWDDDVDVGVLRDDVLKIEAYHDDDYFFEPISFGFKFKKRVSSSSSVMFVDVMVYDRDGENQYRIANGNFPKEMFYEHELFPLREASFNGATIPVPNDHRSHLDRAFPEWDAKIKFDCGHHGGPCAHEAMGLNKEVEIAHHPELDCYAVHGKTGQRFL